MKLFYKYRFIFLFLLLPAVVVGQNQTRGSGNTHFFNHNIDYHVRAYFSIGGSTPVGFPESIRKIEQFDPALQLALAADATKWLDDSKKWGIRAGIAMEGKGMKTQALVKKYKTEIIQGNSNVSGYFYGQVNTRIKNTYFTVPVTTVYNLNSKWDFSAGLYASAALDREFDGHVSNGYLRQGSPTGSKLIFEEGSRAEYDFSENESKFQWGSQVGAEYLLNNHFGLFSNLTYGINNLFEKDFHTISFSLHNLYLNFGFGYKF